MLAECVRVLLRRWAWVIVALVLALGAGAGAYKAIQPKLQSNAQVLFVPSLKQPGVNGPTNPFTQLNGSMGIVASVVQVAVTDSKTAQALYDQGARASYQVVPNLAENAGPILLVTVDDKSAAMTQRTLTAVLAQINQALRQLQVARQVPADLFINAVVLTSSAQPQPVRKAQVQAAVLTTVGLFFLLIIVILAVERLLVPRRRRSQQKSPDDGWGEPRYRGAPADGGPASTRRAAKRLRGKSAVKAAVKPEQSVPARRRELLEESLTGRIGASSERPD